MIPLRRILDEIRTTYDSVDIRYLHPSIYVICTDDSFHDLDPEQRMSTMLSRTSLPTDEVHSALDSSGVIVQLLTPKERQEDFAFLDSATAGHHWLEFLLGSKQHCLPPAAGPRVVHCYGFKGGQARSTVLAILAKALANDGYFVLAVDADIEAPSLHKQFGAKVIRPESTLIGCVLRGLQPSPQPVHIPHSVTGGRVDFISCKPSDPAYDLDLASFALHSALNPELLRDGFAKILASAGSYDLVLVDHRSGLSSSVLPIAAAFPGAVIIFARLDEQSDEAETYFDVLFSQNPEMPGVYVSFSLDPDDTEEKLRNRHREQIDSLLEILARAIRLGAANGSPVDSDEAVTVEELQSYWISWFHDRSFLAAETPAPESVYADNRAAISRIRELIGLQAPKKRQVSASAPRQARVYGGELSSSGNTDEGLLIETEALRKLVLPNTPYTYILGRKGTGKTRLVRALVDRQLGTPMLAADDFKQSDVVLSSNPTLKDLVDVLGSGEAEKLWWILLDTASPRSPQNRNAVLQQWLTKIRDIGPSAVLASDITRRLQQSSDSQVYFIDGVETAFNSSQMSTFVEGLFRFLSSVQSARELTDKVTIRLFIRTDLVRLAVENIEQQIEGRALHLFWDTQSILNFALSRIGGLDWFRRTFSSAIENIDAKWDRLAQGSVSEAECNEILLDIFPTKLRRNNLLTLTFLKDYFSEGVGESASYYPRIYDTFVRAIADPSDLPSVNALPKQIEEGRVAQPLVIACHDYASKEYLNQVAAELKNLVELSGNPKENQQRVEPLIEAFGGLPTPFELEDCVSRVHERLNDAFPIDKETIRRTLQQMKRIGIFEDRPSYPGWWRVGRLFKTALGMKYVR